jgi:hypothetical protein
MPKICPFSARSQTALCLALSGASSRSQPESAHTKARRAEVFLKEEEKKEAGAATP